MKRFVKIFESNGRTIKKTPEVFEYLTALVQSDERISSELSEVRISPQNWSLGGGVHFVAAHKSDGAPVILKVGAYPNEVKWFNEIFIRAPKLCPRLYAKGIIIGDIRIGWMITEAILYGPLGPLWQGEEFTLLIEAGVEFQLVSRDAGMRSVPEMTLDRLMAKLEAGLQRGAPSAAGPVVKRAPDDFDWISHCLEWEICHGDLHLCNGRTRVRAPRGPAVLIDFQPIRQPWALDAAYLQVLNSSDPKRPGFRGLIPKMADARRKRDMTTAKDIARVSRKCLGWLAISRWGLGAGNDPPSYQRALSEYMKAA
jgi:hypothetical protein